MEFWKMEFGALPLGKAFGKGETIIKSLTRNGIEEGSPKPFNLEEGSLHRLKRKESLW